MSEFLPSIFLADFHQSLPKCSVPAFILFQIQYATTETQQRMAGEVILSQNEQTNYKRSVMQRLNIVYFIEGMRPKRLENLQNTNKIKFRKLLKIKNSLSTPHLSLPSTPCSSAYMDEPLKSARQGGNSQTHAFNQYRKTSRRNEELSKTLTDLNFQHHNKNICLCGQCDCGRHLCKFSVIRPELLPQKTAYATEYGWKSASKDPIVVAKQTQPLKGENMFLKSNYSQFYHQLAASKQEMIKYEDTLKQTGPCQNLTTYGLQFRNHQGCNQYVKPTDKFFRDSFPMRDKTTYSREFSLKKIKRPQSLKTADELKTSSIWLGQSAYRERFQHPNPEDYPIINPLLAKSQKILKNPDFLTRFTTSYKKEFNLKESSLCPVKRERATSFKFQKLKNLLNEKGDFRGLNPQFHAIATSKHFYV